MILFFFVGNLVNFSNGLLFLFNFFRYELFLFGFLYKFCCVVEK